MTNIYQTWTQLKTKHTSEGMELKYADQSSRWQIYVIDGADAYITYIPSQITLNSPTFIGDLSGLQADLNDFNNNHKAEAQATTGVED